MFRVEEKNKKTGHFTIVKIYISIDNKAQK